MSTAFERLFVITLALHEAIAHGRWNEVQDLLTARNTALEAAALSGEIPPPDVLQSIQRTERKCARALKRFRAEILRSLQNSDTLRRAERTFAPQYSGAAVDERS